MLTVNTFFAYVCDVQQSLGVFVFLAAFVNFNLHPIKQITRAVENRLGLVAVVFNCAFIEFFKAVMTERIVAVILVISAVVMYKGAAAFADCVAFLIAVGA